jgi:hypothetical protein
MFVDENKYISRRLDNAVRFLAVVLCVAFGLGAVLRFSSGGPADLGAWGFFALTGLGLWSILTSNKALRAAVVVFLSFLGA